MREVRGPFQNPLDECRSARLQPAAAFCAIAHPTILLRALKSEACVESDARIGKAYKPPRLLLREAST